MTNTFANLKPGDPEPNFLHLQLETNKSVAELQREYAVMLAALSGKVPAALTEAWAAEKRAEEEVLRAGMEVQAAMRLHRELESLVRKRDALTRIIAQAREKLAQVNSPAAANAAIEQLLIDNAHITVLFTEIMRVEFMPAVRKWLDSFIQGKAVELAQAQADVTAFAAEYGIKHSQ